jgi:hypothetical protein
VLWAGHFRNLGSISGRGRDLFPVQSIRTDCEPTKPPVQYVSGALGLDIQAQECQVDHSWS